MKWEITVGSSNVIYFTGCHFRKAYTSFDSILKLINSTKKIFVKQSIFNINSITNDIFLIEILKLERTKR